MPVRILVPIIPSTISIEKETSSFVPSSLSSSSSSSSSHAAAYSFNNFVSLLYLSMPTCTQTQRIIALVIYCMSSSSGFHFCHSNSHCEASQLRDLSGENRILTLNEIWRDLFFFTFIITVINLRSTHFFAKCKESHYSYQALWSYHDEWIFTQKLSSEILSAIVLWHIYLPLTWGRRHKNPSNLIKNVTGTVKFLLTSFSFRKHSCMFKKERNNLFTSHQRDENHRWGMKERKKKSHYFPFLCQRKREMRKKYIHPQP